MGKVIEFRKKPTQLHVAPGRVLQAAPGAVSFILPTREGEDLEFWMEPTDCIEFARELIELSLDALSKEQ